MATFSVLKSCPDHSFLSVRCLRLKTAFNNIDIVVHAAALKQVPAAEYNPFECIKTNVNGAMNLIDACIDQGVKKVVALSTDKASSPINLYGATKLASDKLFVASNSSYASGHKTCFSVVRYGNVMGSRGSVIPLFINQIKSKNDITITDPEMTRFLMSLEDSVDLVLHAFAKGKQGNIFVQKSPSTTIGELASTMKKIYNSPVEIKNIGIRHAEKIHETLLSREERLVAEELEHYFRVPSDNRDLNYNKYFFEGKQSKDLEEYNSFNTHRLSEDKLIDLLASIGYK